MSDDFQSPPPEPVVTGTEGPSDTGKILAGIGYLTGIVALIAILIEPYKNERFVRVHAIQALALYVLMMVSGIVQVIPVLGQIVGVVIWLGVVVFAIIGAIKAFQGQEYQMPIVYGFVEKFI